MGSSIPWLLAGFSQCGHLDFCINSLHGGLQWPPENWHAETTGDRLCFWKLDQAHHRDGMPLFHTPLNAGWVVII